MNILDKKNNFSLLFIVFIPSLFMMVFKTSSMAFSILLIASSIIFIDYFNFLISFKKAPNYFFIKKYDTIYLFLYVLIHYFFVVIFFFKGQDFFKFIFSYMGFVIIFYSAKLVANSLSQLSTKLFNDNIHIIVYILLLNAIISLTGIDYIGNATHKPVFLFSEPSHFTLVAGSFLMYYIYTRSIWWTYIAVFFLFWALHIQNLTMLLTLIITSLLIIKSKHIFIALLIIVSGIFLFNLNLDYFASRLIFSVDNENLSTLFLMQGWENAFLSIKETYGLGIGFQQLGIALTSIGEIYEQVNLLSSGELNSFDGGTLAAKIIAEYGVIGILITLILVKRAYQSFLKLRKLKGLNLSEKVNYNQLSNIDSLTTFGDCVNVFFVIELFVRGVGYFSPGLFIYLIMYFYKKILKFRI